MADRNIIFVKKIHHRHADRIGLFFAYNPAYISQIKKLKDRRYSKTLNCWYVPYHSDHLNEIKSLQLPIRLVDIEDLSSPMIEPTPHHQLMRDLKTWNTIKTKQLDRINPEQKIAVERMMDYMLCSWYPIHAIKRYVSLISSEYKGSSPDRLRALRILTLSTVQK